MNFRKSEIPALDTDTLRVALDKFNRCRDAGMNIGTIARDKASAVVCELARRGA